MIHFYQPLSTNGQDFSSVLFTYLIFNRGMNSIGEESIPVMNKVHGWDLPSHLYDRYCPSTKGIETYPAIQHEFITDIFKHKDTYVSTNINHSFVEGLMDFQYKQEDFERVTADVHSFLTSTPYGMSHSDIIEMTEKCYFAFLLFGFDKPHNISTPFNANLHWPKYRYALRESWKKAGLIITPTITEKVQQFKEKHSLNQDYTTVYLNSSALVRNAYDINGDFDTDERKENVIGYKNDKKPPMDTKYLQLEKKERFENYLTQVEEKIKQVGNEKVLLVCDDVRFFSNINQSFDTGGTAPKGLNERLTDFELIDFYDFASTEPRLAQQLQRVRHNRIKQKQYNWMTEMFQTMMGEALLVSETKDIIFTKSLFPICSMALSDNDASLHYINLETRNRWQDNYSDFVDRYDTFANVVKEHNDLFIEKHHKLGSSGRWEKNPETELEWEGHKKWDGKQTIEWDTETGESSIWAWEFDPNRKPEDDTEIPVLDRTESYERNTDVDRTV